MKKNKRMLPRCGAVLLAGALLTGTALAGPLCGQDPFIRKVRAVTPESSFQYSLSGGEAVITKYTGTETQVEVPSTLGGCPVTEIGSTAFRGCKTMETLSLPEGLRSIGDNAFYFCPALEEISLPSSLKSIGKNAFGLCQKLKNADLPEELETLGAGAFATCTGLQSVSLPSGLSCVESNTFNTCTSLQAVTLPQGLTAVGERAFYTCTALSGVTLPEGLETIGKEAFVGCSGMKSFEVSEGSEHFRAENGLLYSKDGATLVACPGGKEGAVKVPSGVLTIGACAFQDCDKVTDVTLPKGLTAIEAYAFSSCGGLDGMRLPTGVEQLGDEAFASTSLTNLTVPASVTSFGTRVFAYSGHLTIFGKTGTKAEEYANANQIPFAAAGTFTNCSYLSRSTIPTLTAVTVKGSAVYGKGESRYAYYYKKSGSSAWTSVGEKYGTLREVTLYLPTVTEYKVMVKVKDEQGRVKTKIMSIQVTAPSKSSLVNTSSVSALSLQKGETLTITGASTGGNGTVRYAFYMKKASSKGYTAIGEAFGTDVSVTCRPSFAQEYDIRVLCRDELGTVAIKQYRIRVNA